MYFTPALCLTTIFTTALAALIPVHDSVPTQATKHVRRSSSNATNIPLIIWHGLGDSYDSDGIKSVGELYKEVYPDSDVYVVHLGDSGSADRRATFFGNVTEQVNATCYDIKATPELAGVEAVNALGFSQGGVFIRGLVERCDGLRVRNLATFGSPHDGITSFAMCKDGDWLCKTWDGTLKGNTWGSFSQSSLVPAQYYRDPEQLDDYLEFSNYLADVNNERKERNASYSQKIAALEKFIMIKFEEEDVIQPPESTWFAEFNKTSELLTKLKDRKIFTEDWLGLQELDKKGGLIFARTGGKHMQIGDGVLEKLFTAHFAPPESTQAQEAVNGETQFYGPVPQQTVMDRLTVDHEYSEPCHQESQPPAAWRAETEATFV